MKEVNPQTAHRDGLKREKKREREYGKQVFEIIT